MSFAEVSAFSMLVYLIFANLKPGLLGPGELVDPAEELYKLCRRGGNKNAVPSSSAPDRVQVRPDLPVKETV